MGQFQLVQRSRENSSSFLYFKPKNSGLLEDQVRLKDEEIRNKMTKRPITPPPSHSHMVIPTETLPEIVPPKQEYKTDFVIQRAEIPQPTIKEPAPKVILTLVFLKFESLLLR